MTVTLVRSIEAEYRRYKALGDAALDQVSEAQLSERGTNGGNSLAIICWHVAGNFQSRFTDFLTSDGEKPWRDREEEFNDRDVSRSELMQKWNAGWDILFGASSGLTDENLTDTITIRSQPLAVHEALHRSLAHASYHVGQIVFLAHALRGAEWKYLSIAPGGSAAYNANPTFDKPQLHGDRLGSKK